LFAGYFDHYFSASACFANASATGIGKMANAVTARAA
jgi:hypothetical protein